MEETDIMDFFSKEMEVLQDDGDSIKRVRCLFLHVPKRLSLDPNYLIMFHLDGHMDTPCGNMRPPLLPYFLGVESKGSPNLTFKKSFVC